MVQLTYPGVYIVEKPSGVHTITGVATSIAAFVGFTRKGTPDKAVTINSFADFERQYGGLDRDSPVSYGVRQFFLNGGTQAIIVRVANGFATATWRLKDSGSTDVLEVTAASPGRWGNDLRLDVQIRQNLPPPNPPPTTPPPVRNPNAEFNLLVWQLQADGSFAVAETHRNLTMDAKSSQFVESVVNNASALIHVKRLVAPGSFTQFGWALSGQLTTFPLNPSDRTISGTVTDSAQIVPFSLTLPAPAAATGYADVAEIVAAINTAIASASLATSLAAGRSDQNGNASATGDHLRLIATAPGMAGGESSSVVVTAGAFGGVAAAIKLGLANGGQEFTGAAQHRPSQTVTVPPLPPAPAPTPGVQASIAGGDGSLGTPVQLIGKEADKSGFYALLDVDLFNILSIPETFDMTGGQEQAVIAEAVALCERRRAFYIVDAPSNLTRTNIGGWMSVTTSRNAATYFPPMRIADPLDSLRLKAIAPSGTMAGVYARTDGQRGVWKAPAGIEATLNGVPELTLPINDGENGQLNPLGVNVLRTFPVYGRVSWGARTMRGADRQADEYKYIPIRRLALFLEESLFRGTQWVVFESNDEPLWAQIRLNLSVFMNGLFRQGAFQGTTPAEAYFVKCDKETTTQADRNLGIVNILVGFAPLKPAEFVVLTIQQIAGDLK